MKSQKQKTKRENKTDKTIEKVKTKKPQPSKNEKDKISRKQQWLQKNTKLQITHTVTKQGQQRHAKQINPNSKSVCNKFIFLFRVVDQLYFK